LLYQIHDFTEEVRMAVFNKFRVSKNLFDDGAIEFYFKIEDDKGHIMCDFCVSEEGLYYYRRKSQVLSPREHKGTVGSWDGFLSFDKLNQLFKKLEDIGCSFRDGDDTSLKIRKSGSRIILEKTAE